MDKKIYETPLLSIDEIKLNSILCVSDGTNETVEFEDWIN